MTPKKKHSDFRRINYLESRTERKRMTGYLRAGGVKRRKGSGMDSPDPATEKRRILLAFLTATFIGIGLLSVFL